MRAGQLRNRIVLERRTDTQDAAGQPIPSWATLATVWSSYEPAKGREYYTANALVAESPVLFRIRGRTDLTTKDRVNYGGAIYDIRALVTDDNVRQTLVYADTGLTQG